MTTDSTATKFSPNDNGSTTTAVMVARKSQIHNFFNILGSR